MKPLILAALLLAVSIQGVHADGLPWEFYLDSNQHMEVRITDQAALDGILRATWKAMRNALLNGDTQLAASYVSQSERAKQKARFDSIPGPFLDWADYLPEDITPDVQSGAVAWYKYHSNKGGGATFALDQDPDFPMGVWRIKDFD